MKRNSWAWWCTISTLLLCGLTCVGVCMYAIHFAATTTGGDQQTPYVIASVATGVAAVVSLAGFTFAMCYAKRKDEQEFETL